jgi:hypothetical protein
MAADAAARVSASAEPPQYRELTPEESDALACARNSGNGFADNAPGDGWLGSAAFGSNLPGSEWHLSLQVLGRYKGTGTPAAPARGRTA